ncbi:PREDICTED: uncharacterized protein LOC105966997 [Erythranthe guttata]|uniref:uncharacterized protein LOC105966997 n=1 Tax=Erythranthe guttata TaxID=4155 RepID=UPI00064DBAED|nr:PREDICTED: uncharacterized protein LOC105966997 [Erythranthe guttata]|eukprot:XP_012847016.1 PREDICTED: uncharacterized protein LOC105966997 [Erythranthe guttata]
MPTAVVNNTAAKIAVVSRFVADSTGKTYAGTNKFEIPANGRKNIPSSVFTKETMEERVPIEVHIQIGGITLGVLKHEDFENNKSIIFDGGCDGGIAVRFVRHEVETGFRCFCGIVPFGRLGNAVAAPQDEQV